MMKLLYCKKCGSVFNLTEEIKTCECGVVSGFYMDRTYALYTGDGAVLLGFDNLSFGHAIHGVGRNFTAFSIRPTCPTFKKVDAKQDLYDIIVGLPT